MSKFKIENGNWFVIKSFDDITAAQDFADSLGVGYTAQAFSDPSPKSELEKIQERRGYGDYLINQFLLDNALMGISLYNDGLRSSPYLTTVETLDLAAKFGGIMSLCQLGSIRQVLDILPSIPTDAIFTQQRKDDYIAMITDYLSS